LAVQMWVPSKATPPRSVTDDDGVCDYTGGGHNL
jgi:hypothetical protein